MSDLNHAAAQIMDRETFERLIDICFTPKEPTEALRRMMALAARIMEAMPR